MSQGLRTIIEVWGTGRTDQKPAQPIEIRPIRTNLLRLLLADCEKPSYRETFGSGKILKPVRISRTYNTVEEIDAYCYRQCPLFSGMCATYTWKQGWKGFACLLCPAAKRHFKK